MRRCGHCSGWDGRLTRRYIAFASSAAFRCNCSKYAARLRTLSPQADAFAAGDVQHAKVHAAHDPTQTGVDEYCMWYSVAWPVCAKPEGRPQSIQSRRESSADRDTPTHTHTRARARAHTHTHACTHTHTRSASLAPCINCPSHLCCQAKLYRARPQDTHL
jgi:hypothetical protein